MVLGAWLVLGGTSSPREGAMRCLCPAFNRTARLRCRFAEAWLNYAALQRADYSQSFACKCPLGQQYQAVIADGIVMGPRKNQVCYGKMWPGGGGHASGRGLGRGGGGKGRQGRGRGGPPSLYIATSCCILLLQINLRRAGSSPSSVPVMGSQHKDRVLAPSAKDAEVLRRFFSADTLKAGGGVTEDELAQLQSDLCEHPLRPYLVRCTRHVDALPPTLSPRP